MSRVPSLHLWEHSILQFGSSDSSESIKDDLRSASYRFDDDNAFMMTPDRSPDRLLYKSLDGSLQFPV